MLLGNVTRDSELTYTPNQTAVVSFGLAVNRRWKSKDGQDKDEAKVLKIADFEKNRVIDNVTKTNNPDKIRKRRVC